MLKNSVLLLVLLLRTGFGFEEKIDKNLEARVFDGQKLIPDQNKHLVKLQISRIIYLSYRPQLVGASCSGSIISDRWILTAAHCLRNNTHTITILRRDDKQLQIVGTGRRFVVKDPSCVFIDGSESSEKDIGLLLTEKPIQFTKLLRPIDLATKPIKIGRSAIIAGYGEIQRRVTGPRQGVVTMRKCPIMNGTSLLCSKNVVRAGSGDSGGSLVHKGKLVGVISKSCTDVYLSEPCVTVYVSVYANKDWIEYVTGIQ